MGALTRAGSAPGAASVRRGAVRAVRAVPGPSAAASAPRGSAPPSSGSSVRIASAMCGPLFSITHSARSPIAASVISAREGSPVLASVSSTWVAQTTGICAASAAQRISSCTSARRS